MPDQPSKLWDRVERVGGCRVWTGALNAQGYGVIRFDKKNYLAHRLAWQFTFGPIPDGLCVLHHCDNPPCADVGHLFLGTKGDNIRDMDRKGRRRSPTHKPNCRGETHPVAKLTEDAVLDMRARHLHGHRIVDMAQEHGVHPVTVFDVVHHRTWRHI